MCRVWACTPLAMGIGIGVGASSVSLVIPNKASASCWEGVVNAPILMLFDALPLVNRACAVRSEEPIRFRRAICQVIGYEGVQMDVVIILILISFVRQNHLNVK